MRDGFVARYRADERRRRRRPARRRGRVPRRARSGSPTCLALQGRARRGARAVRAAARRSATTSACSPRSTTRERGRLLGNFPQAFTHVGSSRLRSRSRSRPDDPLGRVSGGRRSAGAEATPRPCRPPRPRARAGRASRALETRTLRFSPHALEAAAGEEQRLAADDRAVPLVDLRRDDQVHLAVLVLEQHEDDPVRGRRAAGARPPCPATATCRPCALRVELRARERPGGQVRAEQRRADATPTERLVWR